MKYITITFALFAVSMFTSCITSLHNLVTYDKVITESRISGSWNHDGTIVKIEPLLKSELITLFGSNSKKSESPFKGESPEDSVLLTKSYSVIYTKDQIKYFMLSSFIRLNGDLYMDIFPVIAIGADSSEVLNSDIKESHTIAKIHFLNNAQVKFNFLSPDFISKQLDQQRIAIKHEKDEMTGNYLVTASSRDLQRFLAKYGKDARLFSEENSITLNKLK